MDKISRRTFLRRTAAAAVVAGMELGGAGKTQAATVPKATVIDITKCDGCPDCSIPRCVQACRDKNSSRFPQPAKDTPIPPYWPRTIYEDWSDKKHIVNRLTPYNWIYVQPVEVEGRKLNIVRRCMHCQNPPCARLCPFGAYGVYGDGSVVVKEDICFGGAKCRDDCPWGIPQRQAGVGLYLKIAPKYGGGGVMYKCDQCHDLITTGQQPACVTACPRGVQTFGDRSEMKKLAEQRRQEINGYIYGLTENGGTSVYYVSPVPFESIDRAMHEQGVIDGKPGRSGMPVNVTNRLDELKGWAAGIVIAPIAGIFAAGYAAYKSLHGGREEG